MNLSESKIVSLFAWNNFDGYNMDFLVKFDPEFPLFGISYCSAFRGETAEIKYWRWGLVHIPSGYLLAWMWYSKKDILTFIEKLSTVVDLNSLFYCTYDYAFIKEELTSHILSVNLECRKNEKSCYIRHAHWK